MRPSEVLQVQCSACLYIYDPAEILVVYTSGDEKACLHMRRGLYNWGDASIIAFTEQKEA